MSNDEKLKEIIFADTYAQNEYEAYAKEYGEDAVTSKELKKAVDLYYSILSRDDVTDMQLMYLKSLIDRKTFTPLLDTEDSWECVEGRDNFKVHKRRPEVIKWTNQKTGETRCMDMGVLNILDQNVKKVRNLVIEYYAAMELSDVEFPYMFTGKMTLFAAVFTKVVKFVSLRTSRGTTVSINKCYAYTEDSIHEITEEEFVKEVALDAGTAAAEAIKSQN